MSILKLSYKSPNNCILIEGGATFIIENFKEKNNGQVFLIVLRFLNGENLYDLNGLRSTALDVDIILLHYAHSDHTTKFEWQRKAT